jgi:putative colanic acid biosynthesis glycosyltransferase
LDLSATRRKRRLATVQSIAHLLTLVSPSCFLRDKLRRVYPHLDIVDIPNGTDLDFEQHLDGPPYPPPERLREKKLRPRVLVVANDLSHKAKADPDVIEALRAHADFDLVTVGGHSPFNGENVINLGLISDRRQLLAIYRTCDVLLFTSTVDNSPLVIIEALSAGLPVLAAPSDAASEILVRIGARPVHDIPEAATELTRLQAMACYQGRSSAQIAAAARIEFGGNRMMHSYRTLYVAAHGSGALAI